MIEVFWAAFCFLLSVWLIYPAFLFVAALLVKTRKSESTVFKPVVSVIVAAHNESQNLLKRISNIFSSDYPSERIELVIASDGSTDATEQVINQARVNFENIKLISIFPQGGRSNAHNLAIDLCEGEILLFTDAETEFDTDFITTIVNSFQDEKVGFASGVLKYRNEDKSIVSESAGIYWIFEYFLRVRESLLGIYSFGSGACCAVRRSLYKSIPPVGDVDFTTPLDVVLQGYKCVHVANAVAYDEMPTSPQRELNARIRMTAKNLYGTVQRWGVKGVIYHPLYSIVIFLHKLGRWLTPFGMLGLFIPNLFLLDDGFIFIITFLAQLLFYSMALAGYLGLKLPLASSIYIFCLSNIGFFIGVLRALTGKVPKLYKPVSQS